VAFVTQYDVEAYQRLEALIMQKLPQVRLLESLEFDVLLCHCNFVFLICINISV
jgi:hypothetical protein